MKRLRRLFRSPTPQSQPIPGSTQVPNNAGGFSWAMDDWNRLDRFLILGSEGGTYYINEQALTVENAQAVARCLMADGPRAIRRIVEVSGGGKAPKNDPALFALAMATSLGDDATRRAAQEALPHVARIGTHLFHFLEYVEAFRGWGRGLRRSVAAWYTSKAVKDLTYQLVKYRQRDGWSHRDALRLSHPKAPSEDHQRLFHWVTQGQIDSFPDDLRLLEGYLKATTATTVAEVVGLITEYNLPREALPTQFLGKAEVWEALLPTMPLEAMVRNLANMTRCGLLTPGSQATHHVMGQLENSTRIRKARLHPIKALGALVTYRRGMGARSQGAGWMPVPEVTDALDRAFYLAFDNLVPTNKPLVLALDVSGSMSCGEIASMPGLSPRVASAAMSLVTAASERNHTIVAFSSHMVPLAISPDQRLEDVIAAVSDLPFAGTDCALPMIWALQSNVEAEAFIIYTDSETWFGQVHPAQALKQYRETTGLAAKLIVVAMVSNGFTIADPNDGGMLDIVGFSTDAPQLMADFIRAPAQAMAEVG